MLEVLVSAVVMCNNFNLHSYPCNAPVAEFHQTETGFEGVLESDIPFTYLNVVTGSFEPLGRMSMQNAYWYICRGEAIWAKDDLTALSKCLWKNI